MSPDREHLKETDFDFSFEVTETSALADFAGVGDFIGTMEANYGVSFGLDDFGNGYSSFAYLQGVPFRTVKISRTFVAGIEKNPLNYLIVQSIAGIARILKQGVVAEGVESRAELETLH